MNFVRSGAAALITGAVITCLVFAFHPSHVDPQPILGPFDLSQIVHAAAITSAPLLFYGMWAMAEWLGVEPLTRLGLICAGFAMALTVNAAVVSSFVTPAAARATDATIVPPQQNHTPGHAPASTMANMPPLVQLSVALNRGLAQVHVAMLSVALLLFGLAFRKRSAGSCATGLAVGAFPLAWQLSGTFSPNTHTMPLIAFAQGAWLIAVSVMMLRRDDAQKVEARGARPPMSSTT